MRSQKYRIIIFAVLALCLALAQMAHADMSLGVQGGGLGQPMTFTNKKCISAVSYQMVVKLDSNPAGSWLNIKVFFLSALICSIPGCYGFHWILFLVDVTDLYLLAIPSRQEDP